MTDAANDEFKDTWSEEALLTKAQRYAEAMLDEDRDDWRFGLWSSLALELLLRAALANFDRVLLADPKDWNNILSAAGYQPKAKKFIPKSIATTEVVDRLAALIPEFDPVLAGFCLRHTAQRNKELHSGDAAFDGVKHSSWLPVYYKSFKVLLTSMDVELSYLLGDEEAKTAETLIAALADEAAKAVQGTIHAHKAAWDKKPEAERTKLVAQASVWATRHAGHRVKCPVCGSDAIVMGEPISVAKKSIDGDLITEAQEHLPSKFECVACSMKIAGVSQLHAAGVGDVYNETQTYDAAEYYTPEDNYADWEPDNNEPV